MNVAELLEPGRTLFAALGAEDGLQWTLQWGWPGALWLPLLMAAAVAAAVAYYTLREGAGGAVALVVCGLRVAAVIVVALMTLQPELALRRIGTSHLAVIIDDSLSMAAADHYGGEAPAGLRELLARWNVGSEPERWQLVCRLLEENNAEWLREVSQGRRLRVYLLTELEEIGGTPAEIAQQVASRRPKGEATRLGSAVFKVIERFQGVSLSAVVLVTDGVNTQGPPLVEAAEAARSRGVAVYAIAVGGAQRNRDLRLFDLLADETVFADDMVVCTVRLAGTGYAGKRVQVTVRDLDSSQQLARAPAVVGEDETSVVVRVGFRPPREGRVRVQFEVEPQADEADVENNRIEHVLNVRKQKVRVLLVDELPSWEYRFLRDTLSREEAIELRTVLQSADVGHAAQDSTQLPVFPVHREELFSYDVLMLGDVNPAGLGAAALQSAAELVTTPGRGGALVFWAGARRMPEGWRGTPLAPLLPFDLAAVRRREAESAGFRAAPTSLGLLSPGLQLADDPEENVALWNRLAPLHWMVGIESVRRGARVLAEHPQAVSADGQRLPLIVVQQVGAGWVLFHATDETHRWRIGWGDRYFARYWVQTLRFLARGRLPMSGRAVALSTDRPEYQHGEEVRFRARFADPKAVPPDGEPIVLTVGTADGPDRRVELWRSPLNPLLFEGSYQPVAPGEHRATALAATIGGNEAAVSFRVRTPLGERTPAAVDLASLRAATEAGRGRVFPLEQAERLADALPSPQAATLETLPPRRLWNSTLTVALLTALLAAQWLVRRYGGMI